ncbi:unnamed protein product [Trichogramma brassicae]|uniref:Uncharacterized protein n=1 Tax=Trichogramma brassicae TaxID=86971 RepID=A0A6H5I089_9HYME|nr:unnamed protein product [Trichogramma brassicae]
MLPRLRASAKAREATDLICGDSQRARQSTNRVFVAPGSRWAHLDVHRPRLLTWSASPTLVSCPKLTTLPRLRIAVIFRHDDSHGFPQALKDELERQLKEMLDTGIIEESNSPYRSNIFLVPKPARLQRQ